MKFLYKNNNPFIQNYFSEFYEIVNKYYMTKKENICTILVILYLVYINLYFITI